MPYFFAHFRRLGDFWVRHNTRIYLSDFVETTPRGHCLGAIVGKNPGSAKAAVSGWGALRLDGDKMLPKVRNIILDAFERAGKAPPPDAYFQILNLFYICGKDLDGAKRIFAQHKNAYTDPVESDLFPIVWFAWGGESTMLDPLKARFVSARGDGRAFFYCPKNNSVITRPPSNVELAKHPQGLPREPLISYLATHFKGIRGKTG